MDIQSIIRHVFGNEFLQEVASDFQQNFAEKTIGEEWDYTMDDVKFTINKVLDTINPNNSSQEGRIGPKETVFNSEKKSRILMISPDKLTVTCSKLRGSGTAQANTALYKGKWQYEVQLDTCGIMQIGWSTIHCKFMRDTGVGDTKNSYGYDGQRKKKWNESAQNYGETWLTGDIIGSTIDFDEETIEFYRNGVSMGIAFDKIQSGQGMAYFPAVSLSSGEGIVANFGSSPFKYPIAGYEPIQLAPIKHTTKANILLHWIENLLKLQEIKQELHIPSDNKVSKKAIVYLFATLLFRNLSPLLNKTYVIEASLLPFIKRLVFANDNSRNLSSIRSEYPDLSLFLDYAWMFLETEEMTHVLKVISQNLESIYRRITFNIDYYNQKESLLVLHALSKHQSTRRHLISKVFFSNVKIHNFLHIKPMDDKNLCHLIQVVCWEHEENDNNSYVVIEEEVRNKYLASIKTIYDSITEVEQMHLSLLRVLFTNTDGTSHLSSSRKLFLKEFRDFLNEYNSMISRRKTPKILGPTLCSIFYELVSLLQVLWKEELPPSIPVLIPIQKICEDAWIIMNQPQLGGSFRSFINPEWFSASSLTMEGTSFEQIRYSGLDADGNISGLVSTTNMGSSTNFLSDIMQVAAGSNQTLHTDQQEHVQVVNQRMTQPLAEEIQPLGNDNQRAQSLDQVQPQEVEPVVSEEQQMTNSVNQELLRLHNVTTTQNRPIESDQQQQRTQMTNAGAANQQQRSILNQERLRLHSFGQEQQRVHPPGLLDPLVTPGNADSKQSLEELLNIIIIMYKCGVNQQLVKVATIKTKMREQVKCYVEYKKYHKKNDLMAEKLDGYYEVCRENIDVQSRHVAWILSVIYSPTKQLQLAWLLRVLLNTLQETSKTGSRFKLVPCSYVESMLMITSLLRTHFDPLLSMSNLPDSFDLLKSVAEFLSAHIPDERIVDKNIRDLLEDSAADFFCSPMTIKCMESVSEGNKQAFIRTLLTAYQGTNWAQTNWILVRIWHGSGFAFRYIRSPHLTKFGPDLLEMDLISHLVCVNNRPCPSAVYQEDIQRLLLDESNDKMVSLFLNSLLNQLNWAFSEFIGMLQIMQNQTSNRITIQMRHVVISLSCFEMLVCLLRVLEMVIVLARPLFIDLSKPNAANMMERLVQFLSQLLIRSTSSAGCFNFILNLDIRAPEFLTLDHFPILSAVAGILVALLGDEVMHDIEEEGIIPIPPVTRVLLSENFPIWSIQFMLNEENEKHNENTKNKMPFSFEEYKEDVSEEEIAAVRRVIRGLQFYQRRLSTASDLNDDDNKCSICYNYNNSVKFEPCGHESCSSCINHHLLNNRLCFFCKTAITRVLEQGTGTILHDFTSTQAPGLPLY